MLDELEGATSAGNSPPGPSIHSTPAPRSTGVPANGKLATIPWIDRKSTRLNSSHANISYAVFCLKKKKQHCHPEGHAPHNPAHGSDRFLSLFARLPERQTPPDLT